MASRSVDGFEIASDAPAFVPGHSGAPICANDGCDAIGVLGYASNNGTRGYAMSTVCIPQLVPQIAAGASARAAPPPPPAPGPILHPDDLQKERFGGRAEDDDVRLRIRISQLFSHFFYFDTIVEPKRSRAILIGPARFYLHDTYTQQLIIASKVNDAGQLILQGLYAYGAYTIGCQVLTADQTWHSLELDLATLEDLPLMFRSR